MCSYLQDVNPKLKLRARLAQLLCNYLRVVHEPHQASLLRVQYEVTAQELATALLLLDVQEATEAVQSVHIRHHDTGHSPACWGRELKGSVGQVGPGRLPEKGPRGRKKKEWRRETGGSK